MTTDTNVVDDNDYADNDDDEIWCEICGAAYADAEDGLCTRCRRAVAKQHSESRPKRGREDW